MNFSVQVFNDSCLLKKMQMCILGNKLLTFFILSGESDFQMGEFSLYPEVMMTLQIEIREPQRRSES